MQSLFLFRKKERESERKKESISPFLCYFTTKKCRFFLVLIFSTFFQNRGIDSVVLDNVDALDLSLENGTLLDELVDGGEDTASDSCDHSSNSPVDSPRISLSDNLSPHSSIVVSSTDQSNKKVGALVQDLDSDEPIHLDALVTDSLRPHVHDSRILYIMHRDDEDVILERNKANGKKIALRRLVFLSGIVPVRASLSLADLFC